MVQPCVGKQGDKQTSCKCGVTHGLLVCAHVRCTGGTSQSSEKTCLFQMCVQSVLPVLLVMALGSLLSDGYVSTALKLAFFEMFGAAG